MSGFSPDALRSGALWATVGTDGGSAPETERTAHRRRTLRPFAQKPGAFFCAYPPISCSKCTLSVHMGAGLGRHRCAQNARSVQAERILPTGSTWVRAVARVWRPARLRAQ